MSRHKGLRDPHGFSRRQRAHFVEHGIGHKASSMTMDVYTCVIGGNDRGAAGLIITTPRLLDAQKASSNFRS